MRGQEVLHSKKSDEWVTPQQVFDKLNEEFFFSLDAAATSENAKCQKYFTKEDNALFQQWFGNVWLNPPYSRCKDFVKKAYEEVLEGNCKLVVLLIPSRTDTRWFHEYIYGQAEIRFIKGRLKFSDSKNAAPFPSMLVIFKI